MSSQVILSGFADEAALDKTIDQQFAAMAALGLDYLSIRFIDAGNGIRNVLDLDASEMSLVQARLRDYGLSISSIGSPIGKVKVADFDDGTNNRFVPFADYLTGEVLAACDAAEKLQCRLIRGFSFYHPRDTDYRPWLSQASDYLGQIADVCESRGLTFGVEVEANLIGHTGDILAEIHRSLSHPALTLVFDSGNLVTQGFSPNQILAQFSAMLPGLGWMHVKDYLSEQAAANTQGGYVDEDALDRFVPADMGSGNHVEVFRLLGKHLPQIIARLQQRDVPGFFVELEPHLRGGGQFGGFSGPDGMGVALRALTEVLAGAGIDFQIRNFASMRTSAS
ncbi:MAG: sugar phosphate isomerase/epimerase family protein [Pirellulaceae bacterium]